MKTPQEIMKYYLELCDNPQEFENVKIRKQVIEWVLDV
jgi:hypothetical protein